MKFIYLMKNASNDSYKIGIGKDPKKRVKQLQTGNDDEIILIETYLTKIPFKIEGILHRTYNSTKKRGEWFTLSLVDEIEFSERCKQIEKNIQFLRDNGNVFA